MRAEPLAFEVHITEDMAKIHAHFHASVLPKSPLPIHSCRILRNGEDEINWRKKCKFVVTF